MYVTDGKKDPIIIAGGNYSDPDQMQLSLVKAYKPLKYGDSVSKEDLGFINTQRPPDHASQCQFNPPPEDGTVCFTNGNLGGHTSLDVGEMPQQMPGFGNVAGNDGLYDLMKLLFGSDTGKNRKPGVKETIKNGVKIREIIEKGPFTRDLISNIADHGAWNSITGQKLKEIQNIATALQNFAEIPGADMLAQLPGQLMNLSSLIKNLTNQQRQKATQNMSPGLINGFDNMITLMGETTTDRINPEVFTENMVNLLSQVTNISDLITVLHRLKTDETLRGLEEYTPKTDSGLKATTTVNIENNEYSTLILSDIVDNSRVHFDKGFSLSINNQTYLVVTSDLTSNQITVYPKITDNFENIPVFVHEPILEFKTAGPYGPMTMTMDINGNVKPNKDSSQQLQQALQAISGLFSSAEAGGKNLFGDMSGIMGQLFNRIPNNIRASVLSEITNVAKMQLDPTSKLMKQTPYPFGK
jgi:hypothetical protein